MYSLNEAQKGVHGKPPKQKEIQKIQDNLKHLQPLLEKSETKYHKACGSVELARQDWQTSLIKGCEQLQTLDEQRITQLSILLKRYTHQIGESSKKMSKMHDTLQRIDINVVDDIDLAAKKYGNYSNVHEIYLFDIYSENTKNMMNRDRRIANLNKWSSILSTDIQSQMKCIEGNGFCMGFFEENRSCRNKNSCISKGLDRVKNFHKENPKFANNEDDVRQKINSIELLQNLYEGSLFKINCALSELHGKPKPGFKYEANIILTYDKLGVPISILRLGVDNASAPPLRPSSTSPPKSASISLHSLNTLEKSNVYVSYDHGLNSSGIVQMPQPDLSSSQTKQSKTMTFIKNSHPPTYKDVITLPFTSSKRAPTTFSVDSGRFFPAFLVTEIVSKDSFPNR
jgi:hypothetical protein